MGIINALSTLGRTVRTGYNQHRPEIKIIVATGCFVGALYSMYKATTETSEILDEAKVEIDVIHAKEENPEEEFNHDDAVKEIQKCYVRTGIRIAKAGAPVVLFSATSISLYISACKEVYKMYLGASAAYFSLKQTFDDYRYRVIEDQGYEVDQKYMYGVNTFEKETALEDGSVVKETKEVLDKENKTPTFTKIRFDERSPLFKKDRAANFMTIARIETELTGKMRGYGLIHAADVMQALYLPLSALGPMTDMAYEIGNLYNERIDVGQDNRFYFRAEPDPCDQYALYLDPNWDGLINKHAVDFDRNALPFD